MRIHNSTSRIIISTLLMCTFLTMSVGKVTRVSALADRIEEISPIFDTQIYQFQEYVENMGDPQQAVLWLMLGFYIASQSGLSDYTIKDEFANEDGVIAWLKSCGIRLYNSMVNLGVGYDVHSRTDFRPYLKAFVEDAMGIAQKANTYSSEQDFLDDLSSSDAYYLPFRRDSMFELNHAFGINGEIKSWQVDRVEYEPSMLTGFTWMTLPMNGSQTITYNNYLNSMSFPVHTNYNYYTTVPADGDVNMQTSFSGISQYCFLFADTTNNSVYFCDSLGHRAPTQLVTLSDSNQLLYRGNYNVLYFSKFSQVSYQTLTLSNYADVRELFIWVNQHQDQLLHSAFSYGYYFYFDLSQVLQGLYIGEDWAHREKWSMDIDLNLESHNSPSISLPQTDTLLNIKNLIGQFVDTTTLIDIILDNIFMPDGSPINLGDLISVSVRSALTSLYDSVSMPVDLNELSEVTDNDFTLKVKEYAEDASNMIGEYVAFWHNVDYELVYVILGCSLFTLMCAFIGKMGK